MGTINPAMEDEELQDELTLRHFQNIRTLTVNKLTDFGKTVPKDTDDRIFLTQSMQDYERQYFAKRKAKREDANEKGQERVRQMAVEMLRTLKSGIEINPLPIDRPSELPDEYRLTDIVPGEIEQQAGQAQLNYDDFVAVNRKLDD